MSKEPEFLFDVANGDVGMSRRLRNSLERIKNSPMAEDPEMRRRIDDVLAGKVGLREFGRSEQFFRMIDQLPKDGFDGIARMSESERNRLAEEGERELERLRADDSSHAVSEEVVEFSSPPPEPSTPPTLSVGPAQTGTAPGVRKTHRDQEVGPTDWEDEDDQYFRERNQRGWLR